MHHFFSPAILKILQIEKTMNQRVDFNLETQRNVFK